MFQNGQTELTKPIYMGFVRLPEAVCVYSERRSLFVAKRLKIRKNLIKIFQQNDIIYFLHYLYFVYFTPFCGLDFFRFL